MMSAVNGFKFGVVAALEKLPGSTPVPLTGSIETVAPLARSLGYEGLELHIRDPKRYDAALLRRVGDDNGLAFCGIATGLEYNVNKLCLIDDSSSVRAAAVDRLREHMDLAAVIGGPVIVGIMRGNIPDPARREEYLDRYRDSLRQLDAYASATGVPLVVEGINRYICNYLCDIVETADFLDALGTKHIALHIDTHSMNIEDIDMPGNIERCAGRIGYVHYSDSNRTHPGGGHIDFAAIHAALVRARYQGFITVECLPLPGETEAARLGLEFMRSLGANL